MLDKLKGHKIIKIQRIDFDKDYKFFSPNAIIFTLDNLHEKLIFSIINDGKSVDIRMDSFEDIESNYGVEFNENTPHKIIPLDTDIMILDYLDELEKEILHLKIRGYTYREIAKMLGLKHAVQVNRILNKTKEKLIKAGF